MTNKITGYRPTTDHKQECNNIYIILFNKYKAKISNVKFGERIKILNQLKEDVDYNKLSINDQDKLFNELMTG